MNDSLGIMLANSDNIREAHRHTREIVADAQKIIDAKHERILALEAEVKRLKVALAVEQSHSAGLLAKVRAFADVIRGLSPVHPLMSSTGRHYKSGKPEVKADELYDRAFDIKSKELGIERRMREEAK